MQVVIGFFRVYDAFRIGIPLSRIHDITKIDTGSYVKLKN